MLCKYCFITEKGIIPTYFVTVLLFISIGISVISSFIISIILFLFFLYRIDNLFHLLPVLPFDMTFRKV